jgi:hypothetical protein
MNPIYFFWALFARSVLRNLLPDHDHWNSVKWISRFSYHYVGLVQLEPLCLIPFVLRRETRWEGQVDPIKNRVRSKSKLSLN